MAIIRYIDLLGKKPDKEPEEYIIESNVIPSVGSEVRLNSRNIHNGINGDILFNSDRAIVRNIVYLVLDECDARGRFIDVDIYLA